MNLISLVGKYGNRMKYYLSPPASGPFARIIASLLAVCVLAAVVFFGLIAFVILVAVVSIVIVVAWVRTRFLKRGLGRGQERVQPTEPGSSNDHAVIDAEYKVISRRRD